MAFKFFANGGMLFLKMVGLIEQFLCPLVKGFGVCEGLTVGDIQSVKVLEFE